MPRGCVAAVAQGGSRPECSLALDAEGRVRDYSTTLRRARILSSPQFGCMHGSRRYTVLAMLRVSNVSTPGIRHHMHHANRQALSTLGAGLLTVKTPLQIAASKGHTDVVAALLEAAAVVETCMDEDGHLSEGRVELLVVIVSQPPHSTPGGRKVRVCCARGVYLQRAKLQLLRRAPIRTPRPRTRLWTLLSRRGTRGRPPC